MIKSIIKNTIKNKVLISMLIIFASSFLYAHKIPGITLSTKLLEGDKVEIKGFNKRSKKLLDGNKIKLFSQANNKVLFEGYLKKGLVTTSIPKQPYMIFMYVGNQDVVIEGVEPSSGFSGIYASKTNRAYNYTLALSLAFILATFFMIFKNYYLKKKQKI